VKGQGQGHVVNLFPFVCAFTAYYSEMKCPKSLALVHRFICNNCCSRYHFKMLLGQRSWSPVLI